MAESTLLFLHERFAVKSTLLLLNGRVLDMTINNKDKFETPSPVLGVRSVTRPWSLTKLGAPSDFAQSTYHVLHALELEEDKLKALSYQIPASRLIPILIVSGSGSIRLSNHDGARILDFGAGVLPMVLKDLQHCFYTTITDATSPIVTRFLSCACPETLLRSTCLPIKFQ